jgi:hypothetical protein
MRPFILAAAMTLAGFAAQAQPVQIPSTPANNAAAAAQTAHPTGQKPIDNGPTTPDSNAAYQGGGVILQGAPGAPAPAPQRTDPVQTQTNSVPKP